MNSGSSFEISISHKRSLAAKADDAEQYDVDFNWAGTALEKKRSV